VTAREHLAQAQADLLRALLAGGGPPSGFDAAQLAVESASLRAKRCRIIDAIRPDLRDHLGPRYAALFDAYADAHPKTVELRARDDAAAFAAWLHRRGEAAVAGTRRRRPGKFRDR